MAREEVATAAATAAAERAAVAMAAVREAVMAVETEGETAVVKVVAMVEGMVEGMEAVRVAEARVAVVTEEGMAGEMAEAERVEVGTVSRKARTLGPP